MRSQEDSKRIWFGKCSVKNNFLAYYHFSATPDLEVLPVNLLALIHFFPIFAP